MVTDVRLPPTFLLGIIRVLLHSKGCNMKKFIGCEGKSLHLPTYWCANSGSGQVSCSKKEESIVWTKEPSKCQECSANCNTMMHPTFALIDWENQYKYERSKTILCLNEGWKSCHITKCDWSSWCNKKYQLLLQLTLFSEILCSWWSPALIGLPPLYKLLPHSAKICPVLM